MTDKDVHILHLPKYLGISPEALGGREYAVMVKNANGDIEQFIHCNSEGHALYVASIHDHKLAKALRRHANTPR